jgi:hypothetical protein
VASAQIMNFAAGLYTIDLAAQPTVVGREGLPAPCIRLDTLRQPGASAFVSSLAETNLILPGGPPAFVRVSGSGSVPILLTVYRLEHMPPPEVRVRQFGQDFAMQPAAAPDGLLPGTPPGTLPGALPGTLPGAPAPAAASRSVLLVHIEGVGDRSVPVGQWAGTSGSGRALEGFALRPDALSPAESVEYQGALGLEWDTPWFQPDEFCGSRGMTLPLIGLRIRVTGEAAERLVCRYWASFVGKGERGPFTQGALCACEGASLEALRVEFGPPDPGVRAAGRRRGLLGARR